MSQESHIPSSSPSSTGIRSYGKYVLLTATVAHLGKFSPIEPKQMSVDDLLKALDPYTTPVVHFFECAASIDVKNLRKLFGYGGQRRAGFEFMEMVHRELPTFMPEGLADHIESKDMAGTEQARLQMPEIQLLIRDITLRQLRKSHSNRPEDWWWEGIPATIRTEVAARQQSSPERDELEAFFELIDYKKIAAANWVDFQKLMSYGTTKRSRDEQLALFYRLNKLRNRIAHPERGGITDEELEFLRGVKEHLSKALAAMECGGQ